MLQFRLWKRASLAVVFVLCSLPVVVNSQTITHGTNVFWGSPGSSFNQTSAFGRTGFIFNSPSTGLDNWISDWAVVGQIVQVPNTAVAWNEFSYWSFLGSELRGCPTCEASLFLLDPITQAPVGSNLWNPVGSPVIGSTVYPSGALSTTFNLGGLPVTPGAEYLFAYGPTSIPTTNVTSNGLNFLTFDPNNPNFDSGRGCFSGGSAGWDDGTGPPPAPGLPSCAGGGADLLYEATFAVTPEPATIALLGTGLWGLALAGWRRKLV